MLIDVSGLNGASFSINSNKVFRLRPAFGPQEPPNAITLDLDGRRLSVMGDMESLVDEISRHNPLAQLTTPVGLPVFLAATRVVDIHEPSDMNHHPDARAVVSIHVGQSGVVYQQVTESVTEARDQINHAPSFA